MKTIEQDKELSRERMGNPTSAFRGGRRAGVHASTTAHVTFEHANHQLQYQSFICGTGCFVHILVNILVNILVDILANTSHSFAGRAALLTSLVTSLLISLLTPVIHLRDGLLC